LADEAALLLLLLLSQPWPGQAIASSRLVIFQVTFTGRFLTEKTQGIFQPEAHNSMSNQQSHQEVC
jgi:hypothetical protein